MESGRGGSAQDGRGAGPSARRTRSALGRRRRCAGNARIGNRLLHCAHAAPTCRGPARRTRVLSCTQPRACPQASLAPLARRCESLTCTLSALAERAHSQRARLSERATLRHTITPPLPPRAPPPGAPAPLRPHAPTPSHLVERPDALRAGVRLEVLEHHVLDDEALRGRGGRDIGRVGRHGGDAL